ncbi:MAG: hypothetical protein R6V17_04715, partial [Halanaerobacter sp.]
MINLYESRTNQITISDLYSKVTIPDSSLHYLFVFEDVLNVDVALILKDHSDYPQRYSTFYFTDGSDGTIRASGEYNIYESPIDSSLYDASIMTLLENGQYTYVPEEDIDIVYDPSLFNLLGNDVAFDPVFRTNAGSVTVIPHNDLSDRDLPSNHPWALPEASLGDTFTWDSGYVDASFNSMDYSYVDGSLAERDASIEYLAEELQKIDPSSIDLYNYIDGSLAERDTSIEWLNDNKADSSEIPTDFYSQAYVDGSLNNKADNSEIPTDFYSQSYVDGSLNDKAD